MSIFQHRQLRKPQQQRFRSGMREEDRCFFIDTGAFELCDFSFAEAVVHDVVAHLDVKIQGIRGGRPPD